MKFVPFSLEAGGVWGPAAKQFFKRCAAQADNQDRDVDLYHWSGTLSGNRVLKYYYIDTAVVALVRVPVQLQLYGGGTGTAVQLYVLDL